MSAGFYCPQPDCNWEGLAMPSHQACPRCHFAVEPRVPSNAYPKPQAPPSGVELDERGLNVPSSSTRYVLDKDLWNAAARAAAESATAELYERYLAFGERLARMVASKQIAYGDSFRHTRKVLAILFPNGVTVERYGDLLTITRIIDKLFRVANQKGYGGESPYEDIAGYAIRAACEDEQGVASTPDFIGQKPVDI